MRSGAGPQRRRPIGSLEAFVALDPRRGAVMLAGMKKYVRSALGRPDETRRRILDPMFDPDPGARAWLERTLLRPGQVAVLMQVSRRSVAAWAAQGKIRAIMTPGGHRRFLAADVRRLVESLTVTPAHPSGTVRRE